MGFSVPDRDLPDPIWKDREGENPRDDRFLEMQREERRALERHARQKGCHFIINPTVTTFNKGGALGRYARLAILREFLVSMVEQDQYLDVVCSPKATDINLVIVGNHFVAESMVPRQGMGYRQTLFHSHAPTVLERIRAFDRLFFELKQQQSTEQALQAIDRNLAEAYVAAQEANPSRTIPPPEEYFWG